MAALSAFRRLLRASKVTFKNDAFALKNASITLKQEFLKNKDITDASQLGWWLIVSVYLYVMFIYGSGCIEELMKGVHEVEEMLLFNIVQGVKNERGNFSKSIM